MALFHECTPWCAQNELEPAHIFRDAIYRLTLFGDNPVRPLDHGHEDCRTAEFCSPVLQIGFRDPTGPGTRPSSEDWNPLGHNFVAQFAQGRPTHRENRLGGGV